MASVMREDLRIGGEPLSRIAWTRGYGCGPLAELLANEPAIPITGDLRHSCVSLGVDLLVARRLTSFDLVPVVVPHSVEPDQLEAVTAAVAGGPHSALAAAVAARIALVLGVPGTIATVHHGGEDKASALGRLAEFEGLHPRLQTRVVEAPDATGLLANLSPTTLLVLGAPGGSWLQRQFFGQGHQLKVAAPGGAVVVRSSPRRCYHRVVDAAGTAVGPHMRVADARQIVGRGTVPVAEDGRLVGILRTATLEHTEAHQVVADLMEPPVAVEVTEPAEAVEELRAFLDGGPVPVVDHGGQLIGVVLGVG